MHGQQVEGSRCLLAIVCTGALWAKIQGLKVGSWVILKFNLKVLSCEKWLKGEK